MTTDAGNHVAIEVHPATLLASLKILFVADVFGDAPAGKRSRSACPA